MMERGDEQLIGECLLGNQDAWVTLIRRYRRLIYAVIRSYHLPDSSAADVFQSVCLELFSHLARLRQVTALPRWLVTVTSHQCLRSKRAEGLRAGDESLLDVELLPDAQTAQWFVHIERQQIVQDAMSVLSSRCREMIELLFLTDPPIPYAQVASRLRLAVGSIGFIRQRCLKKLKAALEERGF